MNIFVERYAALCTVYNSHELYGAVAHTQHVSMFLFFLEKYGTNVVLFWSTVGQLGKNRAVYLPLLFY